MANPTLAEFAVKMMFYTSIKKLDMTKFLDILRLAKGLALVMEDREAIAFFDRELNGYGEKDELPEYRIIDGVKIRESVSDILEEFDRWRDDGDRILWFDGESGKKVGIRLREFKFLLINLENMIMDYKDRKLSEMGIESALPQIARTELKELPDEMAMEDLEKMYR